MVTALRRRNVARLDLMVATHGDEDHVGGLRAVLDSLAVARLWHPGHRHSLSTYFALLDDAAAAGARVEVPPPGTTAQVGEFGIEVFGPQRRYLAENDESVVLRISAAGESVFLGGDIEAVSQQDIGAVRADVVMVPHHGSATTDLAWLAGMRPAVAVISVGPNPFGHPAPSVLEALAALGSVVRRTDQEGDIDIVLGVNQLREQEERGVLPSPP